MLRNTTHLLKQLQKLASTQVHNTPKLTKNQSRNMIGSGSCGSDPLLLRGIVLAASVTMLSTSSVAMFNILLSSDKTKSDNLKKDDDKEFSLSNFRKN